MIDLKIAVKKNQKMTARKIQIFETSPEQIIAEILCGVSKEIESLKNEFQPKQPEQYLTRNEVKDLLKIDLSTLWSWTRRGKLKSYGIGNRIYYKRSEIENNLIPIDF
jgi:hypothetical protein